MRTDRHFFLTPSIIETTSVPLVELVFDGGSKCAVCT